MKKKRTYRSVGVEKVEASRLLERLGGKDCVVAIDVAKQDFYAAIAAPDGEVLQHLRFRHPVQTGLFLKLLEALKSGSPGLVVVLEPTGTYGDALRHQAHIRNIPVHRVNPKRVHDAAEVFDGVPSSHDAKACALLAQLHAQGVSQLWPPESESKRRARALVSEHELYADTLQRHMGRLEALLARHWPELESHLDPKGASTLAMLEAYPSPADVVANADKVELLLRKASHGSLRADKIASVLESARASYGMPMTEDELRVMRMLVREMQRLREEKERVETELRECAKQDESASRLAPVLGAVTAMVVISELGDPASYASASAYQKAAGLNLKERSSGKHKGRLRITKRGSPKARKYYHLATLRLLQRDPVVRAWCDKRAAGSKLRAITATTRKLVLAIWHVARGNPFDASKLFDTRKLKLTALVERAV